jgi:hypothetical protein
MSKKKELEMLRQEIKEEAARPKYSLKKLKRLVDKDRIDPLVLLIERMR